VLIACCRNDTPTPITLEKERTYIQLVPLKFFEGPLVRVGPEDWLRQVNAEDSADDNAENKARAPVRGQNGFGWSESVRGQEKPEQ
jgi:hypothetical protein